MNEKVEKFIHNLKQLNEQLPEIRDYFWLDIDRSSDTDRQRGIVFDSKFEKIKTLFSQSEKKVTAFLEESFYNPQKEAYKEAMVKLKAEFPNFDDWNEEAKNALIEKYTNDILKSITKPIDDSLGFSRRKISSELNNLTILSETNEFSDEFLSFYNSLDQTPSTHNSQKFIVRKYLLENGYDPKLVNSIKGFTSKSKPTRLSVYFPDGTEINNHFSAGTLAETIKKIGVDKVVALNMVCSNLPFVSKDKNMKGAFTVEDGYFVNTNSSTVMKKRQLEEISQRLNLDLKIDIVDR